MNELQADTEAANPDERVVSCEEWRMAAELSANDVGFFFMAGPKEPKFTLLVNDTFAYASADAENVEWDDIEEVYLIEMSQGWKGIVEWVSKKRGIKPLPEVLERLGS